MREKPTEQLYKDDFQNPEKEQLKEKSAWDSLEAEMCEKVKF